MARLLCLDAGKGSAVRLMKCHEQGGGQGWEVRPGGRGGGTTVYSPATGQCLLVQGSKVGLGLCSDRNTAVWSQLSLD